jgi:hypothetical protein
MVSSLRVHVGKATVCIGSYCNHSNDTNARKRRERRCDGRRDSNSCPLRGVLDDWKGQAIGEFDVLLFEQVNKLVRRDKAVGEHPWIDHLCAKDLWSLSGQSGFSSHEVAAKEHDDIASGVEREEGNTHP